MVEDVDVLRSWFLLSCLKERRYLCVHIQGCLFVKGKGERGALKSIKF